jgi:hypothetical protein
MPGGAPRSGRRAGATGLRLEVTPYRALRLGTSFVYRVGSELDS